MDGKVTFETWTGRAWVPPSTREMKVHVFSAEEMANIDFKPLAWEKPTKCRYCKVKLTGDLPYCEKCAEMLEEQERESEAAYLEAQE